MEYLTSIDGKVTPPERAVIPVSDLAVLRGDGAFEVVRVYGGKPFALADHLDRLKRSCAAIELDCPRGELESEIERLLQAAQATDCLLRVAVTRGGRRLAILEGLIDHPPALSLYAVTYAPSGVLTGVKSLSYAANMQATRQANAAGFDEALLVSPEGVVLEAPTATIFWVGHDHLRTPSLDVGILASITRDRLMRALEIDEGAFALEDVLNADEVFIASTTREVQAVNRVAERHYPAPGPITERAAEVLRQTIERELAVPAAS